VYSKLKIPIGVINIDLIHKSHGLTEQGYGSFEVNQEKFCKKYNIS
jgi:hypothetical protein